MFHLEMSIVTIWSVFPNPVTYKSLYPQWWPCYLLLTLNPSNSYVAS